MKRVFVVGILLAGYLYTEHRRPVNAPSVAPARVPEIQEPISLSWSQNANVEHLSALTQEARRATTAPR